jgi:hypothetical protein
MDLVAATAQLFPTVEGVGYAEVDAASLEAFAASRDADAEIGPHVIGVVGYWIGTGDPEPVGCAMALIVEPDSGAAQHAADQLAAGAEALDIEGQPCYRFGDDAGSRYLVTCSAPAVVYLSGHDDLRLAEVAGSLFRGWKAAGRA